MVEFPAVRIGGGRPVTLRLEPACRAGASLFCHAPKRICGKSPWCCPRQAEFWRLCCTSWCATYIRLVRLRGIAPRPSPWQGDILLLNHSREIKGAGSYLLPARAISTKNKHLLAIYLIPTRGFTAAVSVFRGTPPPKPLECKFWLNTIGALLCDRWT